ncbi:hypothetical protein GCM10027176_43500 [Actinoallomurus bryophytorum]
MSDVIDPNAIPIPGLNQENLETAGKDIKADGVKIAQTGHDIDSDWQGLKQFYHSPEAELLFAKTKPVATAGDGMKVPTQTVGDALTTFAQTAGSLLNDLKNLKLRAEAFRKKIDGDDDWREDEDKVNEHNNLNDDIFAKLVAYQAAERDCANKITGLFGGTHFVGSDPTSDTLLLHTGEQVYGLTKSVDGVETPWAKPQTYDAPWYEDVWNGVKDFGVGLAQDLSSLVGMYGADGWGWQGWGGLLDNWEGLAGGIVGLVGFYGPDGWGWQGWGNLGDNWLNLVNGFVPYREWDGGNGAGYVITQSILNIGSCFVGAGVVKGLVKAGKAARGLEAMEGASTAAKAGLLGREFMAGFKSAFKLPSIGDLKTSLNNFKFKFDELRGLGKSVDDAEGFKPPDTDVDTDTPDPNLPDRDPVHVGGHDDPGTGGGDHGAGDHGGGDHGGGDHGGGDHDGTGGHTDPGDGHTDPTDGHTDPHGHQDPGDGSKPHQGQDHDPATPDPDEAKKLDRANKAEDSLRNGGLTDDQIDRLRGDLPRDSRQWQRLASALSQEFSGKVKGLLHPKAIDFASDGGRVSDPETFAHRYEYFKARFDALRDSLAEQTGLTKKQVALDAAQKVLDLDMKAELAADLRTVHGLRPDPAFVDPHLPAPDLENVLRSRAGDIDMGSDTSAAYHGYKHYDELPAVEKTGHPLEDYFQSAERTIRDGQVWKRETFPDGREELIFRREVIEAGGLRKTMEAIVLVRPDGKVIMKTFGVAKAK